jgi:hypothetical protein
MTFSADLIRFISDIPVLNDGTLPLNSVTDDQFKSTLYDPTYSLSTVARFVQDDLSKLETSNDTLDKNTIVYKALNSDLASYAPDIYLLLRATVLESFAILYTTDTKPENLQYMSVKDIQRIKTNINYLGDYFSTETKYYGMIENMQEMNISFGYLENQIDVIMKERGVS